MSRIIVGGGIMKIFFLGGEEFLDIMLVVMVWLRFGNVFKLLLFFE